VRFDLGFRADLGFISQVGYDKSEIGGSHTWYGEDGAAINQMRLNANWDITRADDGRLLERELEGYFSINGPSQSYFQVGALTRVRYWAGQLFDEHWGTAYAEAQPRSGLRLEFFARHGQQIDYANDRIGKVTELRPGGSLNIGRGISIELNHTWQRLTHDGDKVVEANLSDLRIGWQFDLHQRLRLAWQRGDFLANPDVSIVDIGRRRRSVDTQLIYSYKINPRTALYAGYSEGRVANDAYGTLFARDRSLFAKLTYAWQP